MTPVRNRLFTLVLRHPQEKREALGTGQLLVDQLERAHLATGLSWPKLAKALEGSKVTPPPTAPAKSWGVLYLGSIRPSEILTAQEKDGERQNRVIAVTAKSERMADQEEALGMLRGIVVLDGTWAQAKTMWWRNPWVTKLQRLVLVPANSSLYGKARKEPRRECLSTLEAVGHTLSTLERKIEIVEKLTPALLELLARNGAPLAQTPQAPKSSAPALPVIG